MWYREILLSASSIIRGKNIEPLSLEHSDAFLKACASATAKQRDSKGTSHLKFRLRVEDHVLTCYFIGYLYDIWNTAYWNFTQPWKS